MQCNVAVERNYQKKCGFIHSSSTEAIEAEEMDILGTSEGTKNDILLVGADDGC